MTELATRLPTILRPDPARTVIRPFSPGDPTGFEIKDMPRSRRVVDRVMQLDADALAAELARVVASLTSRHQDAEAVLRQRFDELDGVGEHRGGISPDQALLIASYFAEEFSFESAALFNPSAVRHPDQSGVDAGALRFILSLRGIGEGHISSLTFRTGVWGADGSVTVDTPGPCTVGPRIETLEGADGDQIVHLVCGGAHVVSETVVFPFMDSQGRGIEDVRLVEFTDDDGRVDYRGTFTAFNGAEVRQSILRTADFESFEIRAIRGDFAMSKGMAFFPRRIDGRYFMLGRQDNENIWLLSSDDPCVWTGGRKILEPRYPWEFIQMGNCGSPIEIDEGWLVLTHGVGSVRNYCIGACVLDRADPAKVLGRLTRPLLEPSETERDGYVPNVVYSCGAIVRDRTLLLPYGVADNFTAFATVALDPLLAAMT